MRISKRQWDEIATRLCMVEARVELRPKPTITQNALEKDLRYWKGMYESLLDDTIKRDFPSHPVDANKMRARLQAIKSCIVPDSVLMDDINWVIGEFAQQSRISKRGDTQ